MGKNLVEIRKTIRRMVWTVYYMKFNSDEVIYGEDIDNLVERMYEDQ